jgi:hypothetical protein
MQTMTKQLAAVVMLCFISACGGNDSSTVLHDDPPADTPDYNPSFTGTWQGNATATLSGQSLTAPFRQVVTAVNKNHLVWQDVACPTYWTATSATSAVVDRLDNCSSTSNGCTVGLSVTSGSFVREGDGARASLSGQFTVGRGCSIPEGTAYTYSLNTDLMTRIQGASIAAEGDALGSGVAPTGDELLWVLSSNLASVITDK